ncbi:MAG: hypothetical protein U0441_37980 [Polyangiaceae bacterium]
MENVVSKSFDSPLTLDQMLAALSARVGGVEWGIRESDVDDRYIKGVTSEEVKIRVLFEDPKFSVEVYFPLNEDASPKMSNADKRAFLKRLDGHVLTALKAQNVKDE